MAYAFNDDKSKANIVDIVYPIGSIYMSVNNVNPSTLFGGTWAMWGSGRVPIGVNANDTDFNTAEKTGGEKTHKLTISEMPTHYHDFYYITGTSGSLKTGTSTAIDNGSLATRGGSTEDVGGDTAHNNLQPYITCYMWKRTA